MGKQKIILGQKANHILGQKQIISLFQRTDMEIIKYKIGLLFTKKWFAISFSNIFPHIYLLKEIKWFAFYPKNGLVFNILMVLISILYKREMWFAFYPKNGLLFIS